MVDHRERKQGFAEKDFLRSPFQIFLIAGLEMDFLTQGSDGFPDFPIWFLAFLGRGRWSIPGVEEFDQQRSSRVGQDLLFTAKNTRPALLTVCDFIPSDILVYHLPDQTYYYTIYTKILRVKVKKVFSQKQQTSPSYGYTNVFEQCYY